MVMRIGGARRKSRHIMLKPGRQKGKISIARFLQTFEAGEHVVLAAEPAYQKGIYFRRFHGRVGIVESARGACYRVRVQDGGASKTLIIHPVHLRKA